MSQRLEAHHVSYQPEITIDLCHVCHHKVHFWPNRLTEKQKEVLLKLKFPTPTAAKLMKQKLIGVAALARLIAPSRREYIHKAQKIEQRRLKKLPEKKLILEDRKVYKDVDLSMIKRLNE